MIAVSLQFVSKGIMAVSQQVNLLTLLQPACMARLCVLLRFKFQSKDASLVHELSV